MNLTTLKKKEDIFKSLLKHEESSNFREFNNKMLEKIQQEKLQQEKEKKAEDMGLSL